MDRTLGATWPGGSRRVPRSRWTGTGIRWAVDLVRRAALGTRSPGSVQAGRGCCSTRRPGWSPRDGP